MVLLLLVLLLVEPPLLENAPERHSLRLVGLLKVRTWAWALSDKKGAWERMSLKGDKRSPH